MTLANQVTTARFFLSIGYFVVLWLSGLDRESGPKNAAMLWTALGLYVVTALGDLLDGYLARKMGQVTDFGRIADPLVDKICVVGSFAFFLTFEVLQPIVKAWMVVIILAREFLVHGIRAAAEAKGIPFGADTFGKTKTLLQNLAVIGALGYMAHPAPEHWMESGLRALVWVAMLSTIFSGLVYLVHARKVFKDSKI